MAATFSTLSNELILEICRWLTTKNLARLSLCSKHLYELAQPDLYFTFTQTHKRAIPALIRTLLAKPHLAQYVRTFNGHPFLQHHPTGWQIQITIEDDLRLRGALEELRLNWVRDEPGTRSWRLDLRLWDASAALLITLLPNLRCINLTQLGEPRGPTFLYPCLQEILTSAALLQETEEETPRSLPNLQSVSFRGSNGGWSKPEQFIQYLRLPSVKSFKGFSIFFRPDRFSSQLEYNTTNLTLETGNIEARSLQIFLSCFRSLKYFKYNHSHFARDMLQPPTFSNGLQGSRETLEELVITNKDRTRYNMQVTVEPLGSFRAFERLKKITLSAYILLGRYWLVQAQQTLSASDIEYVFQEMFGNFLKNLPMSLESLFLMDCIADQIWPYIRNLLEERKKNTPKLNELTLDFGYGGKEAVAGPLEVRDWREIFKLCGRADLVPGDDEICSAGRPPSSDTMEHMEITLQCLHLE